MTDIAPEFEAAQNVGQFPIRIEGNSDGTKIGNVADRLKVDAYVTDTLPPFLDPAKFSYIDMNASSGGIARETGVGGTFTDVYSYMGSGVFYGFLVTLEDSAKWYIRLIADSTYYPLFGTTGLYTGDVSGANLYDINDNAHAMAESLGISSHDNTFNLMTHFPLKFNTKIQIQIKHLDATKKFRAGFVSITRN